MGRLTRLVLILIVGAVAGWPVAPQILGSAANRGNRIPPAVVETYGHLTVLRLHGTPYEMGYQHGVAQRATIRRWVKEQVYGRTILGHEQPHSLLLAHAHQLERVLPSAVHHELRGIADGAGLSFQDILILNLVLNRLPTLPLTSSSTLPPPPMLNMQAIAFAAQPPATHQDDGLDNTFLGYRLKALGEANRLRRGLLAIVYQPADGQAYATLTWSGQVGGWCGLNEAGLAICATPPKNNDNSEQEFPPAILTRHLLAHAQDSEQALRYAIQHDYVAAFQLLIADGQRQTATSVTFGAHQYDIVESSTGMVTAGLEQAPLASLLERNAGWLNRDKALAALSNHQVPGEEKPGICDESTLLNVLFAPRRGELWVGWGLWPVSCRHYLHLRLVSQNVES